jgi:hypothetical protein
MQQYFLLGVEEKRGNYGQARAFALAPPKKKNFSSTREEIKEMGSCCIH